MIKHHFTPCFQGQAAKVEKALKSTMRRDEQQKQWDRSGGRDWKHLEVDNKRLGGSNSESSDDDEGR